MSRLDRLLTLLDTGSSAQIRATAASQIGQLAAKSVRRDIGDEEVLLDTAKDVGGGGGESSDWQELLNVVARILPYLQSRSSETRTAAAAALSHTCTLVPRWSPYNSIIPDVDNTFDDPPPFPAFSLPDLLRTSPLLLASSGDEFSRSLALAAPEDIERARKEAMGRLGLDFLEDVEGDWKDQLVQQDDLKADEKSPPDENWKTEDTDLNEESVLRGGEVSKAGSPFVSSQPDLRPAESPPSNALLPPPDDRPSTSPIPDVDTSSLSARELNRLKRKRKPGSAGFVPAAAAKVPGESNKVRIVPSKLNGRPEARRATPALDESLSSPVISGADATPSQKATGGHVEVKESSSRNGQALRVAEGAWVWQGVVDVLQVDLLNPNWEVRHGAGLGLRQVLQAQGASGGMRSSLSAERNSLGHEKWCNDIAAKLLCVLVLDRFGDFVSDATVAPVREIVSQALASVLLHMPLRSVLHVHSILLQMVHQDFTPDDAKEIFSKSARNGHAKKKIWEVMHAGLLGIKYEVAVKSELVEPSARGNAVLRGIVDVAVEGLRNPNDDVQSVAASCLVPVAGALVNQSPESLDRVINVLWMSCAEVKDDLGSSVSTIMELLGQLVTFDAVIQLLVTDNALHPLRTRVPTLYPLFRHTIPSVRLSVVKTIQAFLRVLSLPLDWITTDLLRLLFQNLVLEERADIREVTFNGCWKTVVELLGANATLDVVPQPLLGMWFELVMTPLGNPIRPSLLFSPAAGARDVAASYNVDKSMLSQDLSLVSVDVVLRGRMTGSESLALLAVHWPSQTRDDLFAPLLEHYCTSVSAMQRFLASIVVEEWARSMKALQSGPTEADPSKLRSKLGDVLLQTLEKGSDPPYIEMAADLNRVRNDCQMLLDAFVKDGKVSRENLPTLHPLPDSFDQREDAFTIEEASKIHGPTYDRLKLLVSRKKKDWSSLEDKRRLLAATIQRYIFSKSEYDHRVLASAAGASLALERVPDILNPFVRGLMDGVKFEKNEEIQHRFSRAVASFVLFCSAANRSNLPSEKIVKNLCAFLCQDASKTPLFNSQLKEGILSLREQPPRPGAKVKDDEDASAPGMNDRTQLTRRGAEFALQELTVVFGRDLLKSVPTLWEASGGMLEDAFKTDDFDTRMSKEAALGQRVIDSLEVLQTVVPSLDAQLHPDVVALFPSIIKAARSAFAVIRHSAAVCFAALCNVLTAPGMKCVVEHIVPFLGDAKILENRQGAVELVSNVIERLGVKALPYIIFLIVPILGRMSDSDECVRLLATNVFAALVKMIPLEAGLPDPPDISPDLLQRRATEREFLAQLLDGSKVQKYHIPVTIKAELRPYQQDGVSWLAFLARYHLHGILCDDMGLGKTLQSICILASKHHERAERFAATKAPDAVHLPSLIVCPPTLIGHWYHEILNYTDSLRSVQYTGNARDRQAILASLSSFDVVILSYDVVRNDITNLSRINWHYCVLDEGHVIKNAKAKITRAVKQIRAEHRLILSGTPIQNNVLELWSLFDFLMPGFLGTEQSFNERFGKPILASREKKGSARNQEAGILALEALHKQVLPFLLRRLKEDVLTELPPKIIQDYYCDLSDLQKVLYDEFSKSHSGLAAVESAEGSGADRQHIFQSLQYLRKLCNHPALVLNGTGDTIRIRNRSLRMADVRNLQNAPKLQALRQILVDCGIGVSEEDTSYAAPAVSASSQHRVLIFCQMKQMLDMIEEDLFAAVMPTVTYMRLDGGVEATRRHAIVQTFNADPTIDCLLLTTSVGGLGLNLTGADTVIFVEHDWNPMKDLQAMDRAHRLGQKKVVNVYRLITRGTLEEKIMGLQRFKLNVANSVVNEQNANFTSMDTDVLDLFKFTADGEGGGSGAQKTEREQRGPASQKAILDGLGELPPEDEYANLDFTSFMDTIQR